MLTSHKLSGKYIFITGFLFTAVLGTLSHFFYEWSGNATLIGLFCPVSESAWEHMKLLFFPALLYCLLLKYIREKESPNIVLPILSGILTGTTFIPIFFYTYSGILGFTVVWIDIAIFYICTVRNHRKCQEAHSGIVSGRPCKKQNDFALLYTD